MSLDITPLTVRTITTLHGPQLHVEGEIDVTTIDLFARPLMAAVSAMLTSNQLHLTVDLRSVYFIDSAGLAALVTAHKRLAPSGRKVEILLASPGQPLHVLRLGRFDSVFALRVMADLIAA